MNDTTAEKEIAVENQSASEMMPQDTTSVPVPTHLDTKAVLDYLGQHSHKLQRIAASEEGQIASVIKAGAAMEKGETNEQDTNE